MRNYVISEEESSRLSILKCISMIFVVYIHSYATEMNFSDNSTNLALPQWLFVTENLLSQVIARVAITLFFLMSSILLFKTERNYKKTLINKAKTLLFPYLFWNSFWVLAFILLQSLPFTAPFFSGSHTPILQSTPSEWLALYGISPSLARPLNYPLWFMRDLMVVTLCFPIIGKIADKFPKSFLVALVALLFAPIDFPFKQALVWFSIGACVVKLQIHITAFDGISLWILSPIYALCALLTFITKIGTIGALFSIVGTFYWIRVTKVVFDSPKMRSLFIKLSEWTFIVYVAHELTLTSIKKICVKLLPTQPIWLLMEYLLLPVLVIAGCCFVGFILKKIAPKLYAVLTGAR